MLQSHVAHRIPATATTAKLGGQQMEAYAISTGFNIDVEPIGSGRITVELTSCAVSHEMRPTR